MRRRLASIGIYVTLICVFVFLTTVETGPIAKLDLLNYSVAAVFAFYLFQEIYRLILETIR